MRPLVLTLLFCASAAALCQTLQTVPQGTLSQVPVPTFSLQFNAARSLPLAGLASRESRLNRPVPGAASQDPMIHAPQLPSSFDTGIFLRPSPDWAGSQPPGIPIKPNLYPGLKLQYIGATQTARLEPIPIRWPLFKIKNIPTTEPILKALPIQGSASISRTK
jgi:hypothetical protein